MQQRFLERLGEHYLTHDAAPETIELVTWPQTGAPQEHLGFGRHTNEAKNIQVDFFQKHLRGARE